MKKDLPKQKLLTPKSCSFMDLTKSMYHVKKGPLKSEYI